MWSDNLINSFKYNFNLNSFQAPFTSNLFNGFTADCDIIVCILTKRMKKIVISAWKLNARTWHNK